MSDDKRTPGPWSVEQDEPLCHFELKEADILWHDGGLDAAFKEALTEARAAGEEG